jgi:hypothetical protein
VHQVGHLQRITNNDHNVTFGVSVVSREDENDDRVAIWKDAAVPAFALRSHGNSQHTLSNRHTAGICMHSIRGKVLTDVSPTSCTVNIGALSLGIRRSVRDTDGRRLSNVWIRTFTARVSLQNGTQGNIILSCNEDVPNGRP